MNRKETLQKFFAKMDIGGTISINDLREKDYKGEALTPKEKEALANFDKFRIAELNQQPDDMAFHERYRQLQTIANLGDYEEFLKEKYSL